jgi:hypothetical protein
LCNFKKGARAILLLFKKLDEKELIKVYGKNKNNSGPNVIDSIGLPNLKKKCRHFNEWITKLEGLVKAT